MANSRRKHLDLLVVPEPGYRIGIELKYWKARLKVREKEDQFNLPQQAAQDLGRFDFLHDLCRLEELIRSDVLDEGYAVALTNDHLYWQTPTRKTIDADYRIHDGNILAGVLSWAPGAKSAKTRADRRVRFRKAHEPSWRDYSLVGGPQDAGYFRFLAMEAKP